MPTSPSTRLGLIGPSGGDDLNLGDDVIRAIIVNLDAKVPVFSQGALASRPVSTPGSPGITGRRYYDTDYGLEHYDYGTGWAIVGVPIGGLVDYCGDSSNPCPELMLANGAQVSRTTYATLFARIGTTYGAGNGSTTFNLPDFVTNNSVAVAAGGTIARGATGGAKTVALATGELPSHAHTGPSHVHTGPSHTHTGPSHTHGTGGQPFAQTDGASIAQAGSGIAGATSSTANTAAAGTGNTGAAGTGDTGAAGTGNTGSTGSGTAHQNMQPYVGVYKLIRVL